MNITPSITLEVGSVLLSSRFGTTFDKLHSGKWTFIFKVNLPRGETLVLATGEKAEEIEMSVSLRETAKEFVDWASERTKDLRDAKDEVCGLLRYGEEYTSQTFGDHTPASLMFDMWAPSEVMQSLVAFAQQGRHITEIRLDVAGLEYGWDPDGREKKWANSKEASILPVVNMTYTLPILEEPEPDYSDDETKVARVPITPVGADLAPLLRETLKFQKWALYALAIIAGALVFKGWR